MQTFTWTTNAQLRITMLSLEVHYFKPMFSPSPPLIHKYANKEDQPNPIPISLSMKFRACNSQAHNEAEFF